MSLEPGAGQISETEIEKGVTAYSDDILVDFSNEVRDLCKEAKDVLYSLIGEKAEYRHAELVRKIREHGVPSYRAEQVVEYMLCYGIFGIADPSGMPTYIFDVGYDLKKMRAIATKSKTSRYFLHPALHPSLGIR